MKTENKAKAEAKKGEKEKGTNGRKKKRINGERAIYPAKGL